LHDIFHATVVSRIVYAALAWSGMCSAADRARLDSILYGAASGLDTADMISQPLPTCSPPHQIEL